MMRLLRTACDSPGGPSGFCQAASENSRQTKLNLPAGLLKLNTIMTMTGSIR